MDHLVEIKNKIENKQSLNSKELSVFLEQWYNYRKMTLDGYPYEINNFFESFDYHRINNLFIQALSENISQEDKKEIFKLVERVTNTGGDYNIHKIVLRNLKNNHPKDFDKYLIPIFKDNLEKEEIHWLTGEDRFSRKIFTIMHIIPDWQSYFDNDELTIIYANLLACNKEGSIAMFLRENPSFVDKFMEDKELNFALNFLNYKHGCIAGAILSHRYNFLGMRDRYGKNIPKLKIPEEINIEEVKNLSIDEACIYLFGRNSKKIKKIYINKCLKDDRVNWELILILRDFFSLKFNYDNIISFAQRYNPQEDYYYRHKTHETKIKVSLEEVQLLLKLYNEKRVVELVLHEYNSSKVGGKSFSGIKDVFRMYNQLEEEYPDALSRIIEKPKTIREIHDSISKVFTTEEAKKNSVNLNQDKLFFLEDYKINDLSINVLKESLELVITGQEMKHCVASYKNIILSKECFVFNLMERNKIKYTVAINPDFSIREAKGFQNSHLPKDIMSSLKDLLRPYKIEKKVKLVNAGFIRKIIDWFNNK